MNLLPAPVYLHGFRHHAAFIGGAACLYDMGPYL